MTKRVFSLIICLSLLLSMFAMTVSATEEEAPVAPTSAEFEIVGEWIWGETVAELGADEVVARCAANGITDIYLLVKGTGGMLGYNKTQYTENITREDRDVLQETIDAAHAEDIRVHAWLVSLNDEDYKAKNPEAGNWHFVRERDNAFLYAGNEGYREYMKNVTTEIVSNYDVDGIHLDYIRYNHACNGWSEEDFANLEAMGADIENVKYLIRKTFYQNQLEADDVVDADYIFNQYRAGNPDALLIAEYRRNTVLDFGMMIRETAKAINPEIVISGAIMPEGIYDPAFSDIHYGQNYEDCAKLYDYVVPMAYADTYGYSSAKMAEMVEQAIEKGNKVVMGYQSYYPTVSAKLQADIEAVRALLPNENVLGICHFRHSQFGYAKFYYDVEQGKMDLDAINTNSTLGWEWVTIEAAEGVKITAVTLGDGFAAESPIEIAEDGSAAKIGYYEEDAVDVILPALAKGKLTIEFEGAPTDPNERIAYARIWIDTNESRCYNNYVEGLRTVATFVDHDGTVIEEQIVEPGAEPVLPDNPLRPGFVFEGWEAVVDEVTGDASYTATYREIAPMEKYGDFEIVGEWIHGSDVATLGADVIVERCAKNGITDIYLLVKGTGGTLGYNKTQYTEVITRERDVLQEMVDAGHAVGIRVHAWLVADQDEAYKAANPESGMWHYVRARDNANITPYDEGYNTYMANIATEIATGYEVDGIHLDYIRYNHACNGWSEQDLANLAAMGGNVDNIKYLLEKTFYGVDGADADNVALFDALRAGDPDATILAKYRRQNVVNLAKTIINAAKAVNPDLIMSAALMPEGAVTEGANDIAFADIHYGQNYEDALELYDYVCPMAYTGSYAEGSPEWFAGIAQYAADLGNKVVMGTQAYYPAMSTNLTEEIEAVRQLLPNENILGIVHFRHTQFSYAKFNYSYTENNMTVDIINTYSSAGYKWVQIDAAKGVRFTGAEYGEGFDAEAPIEIAEDGSYVKFGYSSDGEDFVLPTLGEGSLKLTFEGAPADLKAPVAIARIYITNESRAFNVYNDLTKYGLPYEDVAENDWFYDAVEYTYYADIMNGMKETVFAPQSNTTRAQMATVLYRMAGSPSVEGMENPFTDVAEDAWYYEAVVWGFNNKVIKGTSATTFTPDRDVTREELVTLLYRFSGETVEEVALGEYPDAEEVSDFAAEAMTWAIAKGIINGIKIDGEVCLSPKASATRAQIAAIMTRYIAG